MSWTGVSRPYYDKDGRTIILGAAEDLFWQLKREQFGVIVLDPPFTFGVEWKNGTNQALEYIKQWNLFELLTPDGVIVAITNPVHGYMFIPKVGRPSDFVFWSELKPRPVLSHPHARPVTAMSQIISATNGTILDPFMGTGSTLLAAQEEGRDAVGFEIHEPYCELAATLLHTGSKK